MGRDRFFKLAMSDMLCDTKKEITCGVEIECYLIKDKNMGLLNDPYITDEILSELPKTITKDYYPYQLEIRTNPHATPEGMIKELKENIILCHEVCKKYKVSILFHSWLGGDEMFNGLHFHVRYKRENMFLNTIQRLYPLILATTSFFRCSPAGFNLPSRRLDLTPHCGLPNFIGTHLQEIYDRNRFRDVVINMHKENDRHRLKSVNTLETRLFDVPCDWEYLKTMIYLLYEIFSRANNSTPIFKTENKVYSKYYETAQITRDELQSCRHTFNYFVDDFNDNLIFELIKRYKLPYKVENLFSHTDEMPLKYPMVLGFNFLKYSNDPIHTALYEQFKKTQKNSNNSTSNEIPRDYNGPSVSAGGQMDSVERHYEPIRDSSEEDEDYEYNEDEETTA